MGGESLEGERELFRGVLRVEVRVAWYVVGDFLKEEERESVRERVLRKKKGQIYHGKRVFSISCQGAHIATRLGLREDSNVLLFPRDRLSRIAGQLSSSRGFEYSTLILKRAAVTYGILVSLIQHAQIFQRKWWHVARQDSARRHRLYSALVRTSRLGQVDCVRFSCMGGVQVKSVSRSVPFSRSVSE